jgi:hypothetical protein
LGQAVLQIYFYFREDMKQPPALELSNEVPEFPLSVLPASLEADTSLDLPLSSSSTMAVTTKKYWMSFSKSATVWLGLSGSKPGSVTAI